MLEQTTGHKPDAQDGHVFVGNISILKRACGLFKIRPLCLLLPIRRTFVRVFDGCLLLILNMNSDLFCKKVFILDFEYFLKRIYKVF